jgi:hypothetical protein
MGQYSKFLKVHEDKHTATLRHPNGHEVKVAKKALSKQLLKQLSDLPNHGEATQALAKGGSVNKEKALAIQNGFNNATALGSNPKPTPKRQAFADGTPDGPVQPTAEEATQDIADVSQPVPEKYLNDEGIGPNSPSQRPQPTTTIESPPKEDILEQGLREYKTGSKKAAEVEATGAEEQANILDKATEQGSPESKAEELYNTKLEEAYTQQAELIKNINDHKINPNNYMHSMSTGQKIATGIGLIIGGIGAGIAGHGQENPVMKHLNAEIDRDIDSQKAELGKKQSLLSDNFRQLGDLHQAMSLSRAQLQGKLANDLKRAALMTQSQLGRATALKEAGQADMKAADGIHEVAKWQAGKALLNNANNAGASSNPFENNVQKIRGLEATGAISKDDAKESKEILGSASSLQNSIDEMRQISEEEGIALNPFGDEANRAAAARSRAMFEIQHLAGLTRMSHEDIKLLQDQVKDPSSFNQTAVKAKLNSLQKLVNDKVNGVLQARLPNFTPIGKGSTPPSSTGKGDSKAAEELARRVGNK